MNNFAGIDVSKAKLDVCLNDKYYRYDNSKVGFKSVEKLLSGCTNVLLEPTGGYERGILSHLRKGSVSISLVNPYRVRWFARAQGLHHKNDVVDAWVLQEFAKVIKPEKYYVNSEDEENLKDINRRIEQLKKMRRDEKNRLKRCRDKFRQEILDSIKGIEDKIKQYEKESRDIIKDNPDLVCRYDKICKYVGKATAVFLVSELSELGRTHEKKLTALTGLAPFQFDSGQFFGARRIYGGRGRVRNLLYMNILSKIKQKNNKYAEKYEFLKGRGKPSKIALVASMRVLLVDIHRELVTF